MMNRAQMRKQMKADASKSGGWDAFKKKMMSEGPSIYEKLTGKQNPAIFSEKKPEMPDEKTQMTLLKKRGKRK